MKKLILVLAIALMATPAFALDVALVRNGANIDVVYTGNGTTQATRARAFALDLQFSNSALFTGLVGGSYKANGESTAASPGYGIYPAKIQIDSAAGTVTSYGAPDACATDPLGPGNGFGTSRVILEFASLYYGEANAPAASGTLCSLTVNANGASNPVVTMSDELTYRGGVVYENGGQDATAADKSFTYTTATPPGPATNGLPASNVTTATGGLATDLSWTAGTGATSYDVYFGTVLPGSPASVSGTTFDTGTMVQGKTYLCRVVSRNSAGTSDPLNWSFTTYCVSSASPFYTVWVGGGAMPWAKPDCWCYPRNCRGDTDKVKQLSLYWVYTNDLALLKAAYGKADSQLTGNRICADFKRDKQLSLYRVYTNDLAALKSYYGKSEAQTPVCPADYQTPADGTIDYNFWM